jgi:predicted amidohydrolase YtcJ
MSPVNMTFDDLVSDVRRILSGPDGPIALALALGLGAIVETLLYAADPGDRASGLIANLLATLPPYWACRSGYVEELTEPFIGAERSARMYPFGSLLRAGARLAFGSDWTVSTANPLLEIEVAVTRIAPDTRWLEPLLPEEGLDLATALTTFTAGSAYVNFLEGETGRLEPSKAADLVVLDRDVLDPGAGPIGDASVMLTLLAGEAVYADPGLGW